jgi:hypothetical protein
MVQTLDMAAEADRLHVAGEDSDDQSGAQPDDGRRRQLEAGLKEGTPVILGEQLPEWTPENEDPPPAALVIAAGTLRQVLLNRETAACADPRGLIIEGAVIVGDLDLNDATIDYPLKLSCCRFTDPLTLEQITVHALDLKGSHLAAAIRLSGAYVGGGNPLKP